MNHRLWQIIQDHPEIKEADKDAVYIYLMGYMVVPKSLRASLGTEEKIVNIFVEQSRKLETIQSCIDKLHWFQLHK